MFAVLWVRATLDDLERIRAEVDSTQWAIVRAAIREIERRLRDDPESEGESRRHGQRISFVAPLGFTFHPVPDQKIVVVSNVWWFGKRFEAGATRDPKPGVEQAGESWGKRIAGKGIWCYKISGGKGR